MSSFFFKVYHLDSEKRIFSIVVTFLPLIFSSVTIYSGPIHENGNISVSLKCFRYSTLLIFLFDNF